MFMIAMRKAANASCGRIHYASILILDCSRKYNTIIYCRVEGCSINSDTFTVVVCQAFECTQIERSFCNFREWHSSH